MANQIFVQLNQVLNNVASVKTFYDKQYLGRLDYCRLPADSCSVIDSIRMYYRVNGYSLFDNQENSEKMLNDFAMQWINIGREFSFSILKEQNEVAVYFGASSMDAQAIKSTIGNNLHDAVLENSWIRRSTLDRMQSCNGVIVGIGILAIGDIDMIVNSLGSSEGLLSVVASPCRRQDIEQEIITIDGMLNILQQVSEQELSYGTTRVRKIKSENQDVLDTINTLKLTKSTLMQGTLSGLWECLIQISAPTERELNHLASAVTSAMRRRTDSEKQTQPPVFVRTGFAGVDRDGWQLPTGFIGENNFGGLYSASCLNIISTSELARLVLLPVGDYQGFRVRNYGQTAVRNGAFDHVAPVFEGQGNITIGAIDEKQQAFCIPLNSFAQHTFVTGFTQSGKTTTLKRILKAANKEHVPFIVIEAAKKEYWELAKQSELANIQVYSAGRDARSLYIDPFVPEIGTILDSHIRSIIPAFVSLFDDPSPLPQLMARLIYKCYEKKGWDVLQRVRHNSGKEFPRVSDMLEHLDETLDDINYSAEFSEVRGNLRGAVRNRIGALLKGICGNIVNSGQNLSIADLYRTSAVLNLDVIPMETKSFIAGLIAIKVYEYSRQAVHEKMLDRLLVLEEAHHLMPNPELKSVTANMALCSNFFSNMLAEIAAYGTGMIIVDQRPTALSSAAIANTGIKIVHNLPSGEDINLLSTTLSLQDYEKPLLASLKTGQAIIKQPNHEEVCRVNISGSLPSNKNFNVGSLFIKEQSLDIESFIGEYERNYISVHGFTRTSLDSCFVTIAAKKGTELSSDENIQAAILLTPYAKENELVLQEELFELIADLKGVV